MSTTVRRVSQTSLLLLCYATGSCYVGERQYSRDYEELNRSMETSGFYMYHAVPDMNFWQLMAPLFFFLSVSVALAAFRLWRQENACSSSNTDARCFVDSLEPKTPE